MRILLVGSGSGGHFYPLIAITEAVMARAKADGSPVPDLYLMGPHPYDAGSLFAYNIKYVHCPAGKLRRYFSFSNLIDAFKTFWGVFVATYKLFIIYPDVIMSKGSYTSLPVVIAGWFLRIPIVIHESDARPGRANRVGKYMARYIAISYPETVEYFPSKKTALTGIPIRTELLQDAPKDPFSILGIQSDKPLITVVGGSTGAERINDLIASALDTLLGSYTVLHQVGEQNVEVMQETTRVLVKDADRLNHYHIRGFLDVASIHAALSASAIVVSRAGSTSIYEIAIHHKPSILIPIPEDISHDQRMNAYAYARTGGATVIEERNLTPHLLSAEIERIIQDPNMVKEMSFAASEFARTDASDKIAEILIMIGTEHQ